MNSFSRYGPLLALIDFNARFHKMHAGESHFFGPHIFGNKNAHFNAESNKSLLLEMVSACPWEENKSPYYNVGSSPAGTLNSANFGMDMSLAPHHFPAIAEIDVELLKAIATTARDPRYHLSELRCACTSSLFVTSMKACHNVIAKIELLMNYALPWRPLFSRAVSLACIEPNGRRTNPGYAAGSRTLHLLEETDKDRTSRNPHLERMLHGQVKQHPVREDGSITIA